MFHDHPRGSSRLDATRHCQCGPLYPHHLSPSRTWQKTRYRVEVDLPSRTILNVPSRAPPYDHGNLTDGGFDTRRPNPARSQRGPHRANAEISHNPTKQTQSLQIRNPACIVSGRLLDGQARVPKLNVAGSTPVTRFLVNRAETPTTGHPRLTGRAGFDLPEWRVRGRRVGVRQIAVSAVGSDQA